MKLFSNLRGVKILSKPIQKKINGQGNDSKCTGVVEGSYCVLDHTCCRGMVCVNNGCQFPDPV
ncbi:hypothetical protein [Aquimarina sp. RZ0]|uniref:hypothetical protein n=1 Tax=Aquimarina sp. RZ0 TaxID=2607730 RepID=UPI0011F3DB38|nr:hypothetical protein [Aquimarina sp. RZ0]KAA1242764.1 hypothetical protein F0000_24090 [Aquimarina sp. RZ0]